MRVARSIALDDVRIEDVEDPTPGPGEVVCDVLACGVRAQDRAGLRPGDGLLVVGAGVNGLLQIAAAHARAIEAVWVREPREERLTAAEALGAERHGNELVDVAIACTPKPDAIA